MSIQTELERAIVRKLIRTLGVAGFVPRCVWDGGEYVDARTEDAALEAVFAVDESTLHFQRLFAKDDDWGRLGVLLVCGNGEDIVSDYHCGDSAFSAAIEKALDYTVSVVVD